MLTRRAYRYVAAEHEKREKAGQSPAVQVHLTSGATLVVDTVVSYGGDDPEWILFYTAGEDDVAEFVPLECVARITVTRHSKQPAGFTVEERSALDAPD
jgi:hypothetical protein